MGRYLELSRDQPLKPLDKVPSRDAAARYPHGRPFPEASPRFSVVTHSRWPSVATSTDPCRQVRNTISSPTLSSSLSSSPERTQVPRDSLEVVQGMVACHKGTFDRRLEISENGLLW